MLLESIENSLVGTVDVFEGQEIFVCKGVPDSIGAATAILDALSERNIVLDLIVQNLPVENKTDIVISVAKGQISHILDELRSQLSQFSDAISLQGDQVKLSVSGWLLHGAGGFLERLLVNFADRGVEISMISISSSRLEFLVPSALQMETLRCIHSALRTP